MRQKIAAVIDWIRRLHFVITTIIPIGFTVGAAALSYLTNFTGFIPVLPNIIGAIVVGLVSGGLILATMARLQLLTPPPPPPAPLPAAQPLVVPMPRPERQRELLHDGVLWENTGVRTVLVTGPLCPEDKTALDCRGHALGSFTDGPIRPILSAFTWECCFALNATTSTT